MKEGDLIPNIILRSVDSDGMQNFNLVERFQNKKVLIICVPGAFTSTCHNQHLPPYIQNCEILMTEKKIDMVCCITTNDPFVLDLWKQKLGQSKIKFLSDGNEEFLNKTNLIRNYEKSFMGNRLIRSIILLENLKVTKLILDGPGKLDKTSYKNITKLI
jgi:peroxiredoxin